MACSVSEQDESNPTLWLANRAGKRELSCPLGTTRRVLQAKFLWRPYNKSFIDQACSVKMAGYWPRSFFACLWSSTLSRSINTQKKNLANIQSSRPHTWSITHTYYEPKNRLDCSQSPIFLWDRRCWSLSSTGRHLDLLMQTKLERVQNAVGRGGGGHSRQKK